MDDQEEKVNNSATSEAANLALAITRVAERAANEEELRIGVEKLLEPTLQRLWRDWDVLFPCPRRIGCWLVMAGEKYSRIRSIPRANLKFGNCPQWPTILVILLPNFSYDFFNCKNSNIITNERTSGYALIDPSP